MSNDMGSVDTVEHSMYIYVHSIVTNECTVTVLLYTYHMFKNVILVTYEMASDTGIGHGHRHRHRGQGQHYVCTLSALLQCFSVHISDV